MEVGWGVVPVVVGVGVEEEEEEEERRVSWIPGAEGAPFVDEEVVVERLVAVWGCEVGGTMVRDWEEVIR